MRTTTRKLQLMQLEILRDIDRICRENNITYYLVGGTLLGAIRHKGFIPWDDDVDIAMYRSDYNRFVEIMMRDNAGKYFIQNHRTDPNYSRYITKVRLQGTKQVESAVSRVDMHHGIYVDVFPLDNVKKTGGLGLTLRGILLKFLHWCQVFANQEYFHYSGSKPKKPMARIVFWISKCMSGQWINNTYEYLCVRSNEQGGAYTTSFASGYGWRRQLVSNDVYGEGQLIEFEGFCFNAPNNWDLLLTSLYGDYMELPPANKRVAHELEEIDFGIYEDFIESKVEKEAL